MAFQTRSLVTGISSCRTPTDSNAFITAFMTDGSDPTQPASPAPFAPSGFNFVGTGLLFTVMWLNTSARGIA